MLLTKLLDLEAIQHPLSYHNYILLHCKTQMPNHKSEDLKLAAVNYYLKCQNQVKTCEIFGCSERSLMRWIGRYEESDGNVDRRSRNSVAYKVETSHVKFILNKIRKHPAITIKQVHEDMIDHFPDLDISRSHVNNIVLDNNMTLKRSRLRHEPTLRYGKEVDLKKLLNVFYRRVATFNLDDIICIDETSLQSFMTRKYCRNRMGKRCIIKTQSQEVFKRYTGIFAITSRGCIGYQIYEQGGITSERLLEFLKRILARRHHKLVILDNASSHRNPLVKDYILQRHELLYSVPYQHFTNAIENFFSLLKASIEKKATVGWNALLQSVRTALTDITSLQYRNILKGAYRRDSSKRFEKNKSTRERSPKQYL